MLDVTVRKESANESVNRAERRGDYWNFGGIYRPVYLEVLPASFVDRVAIDARADGAFRADVFLGGAPRARAHARARVVDARGRRGRAAPRGRGRAGGRRRHARGALPGVARGPRRRRTWYSLHVTLACDGRPAHEVSERFGFRTFEVRAGDGLYLNGRRIVLKGTNRHSFSAETGRALTPADSQRGRAPHQGA